MTVLVGCLMAHTSVDAPVEWDGGLDGSDTAEVELAYLFLTLRVAGFVCLLARGGCTAVLLE